MRQTLKRKKKRITRYKLVETVQMHARLGSTEDFVIYQESPAERLIYGLDIARKNDKIMVEKEKKEKKELKYFFILDDNNCLIEE